MTRKQIAKKKQQTKNKIDHLKKLKTKALSQYNYWCTEYEIASNYDDWGRMKHCDKKKITWDRKFNNANSDLTDAENYLIYLNSLVPDDR